MTRSSCVLNSVLRLALAAGLILSGSSWAGDPAKDRSVDQRGPTSAEPVKAKRVESGQAGEQKADSERANTGQVETDRVDEELADLALVDPNREIERVLIAEHASKVLNRLAARGRGRDAALALLLRPLARHVTPDAVDFASAPDPELDADWLALYEDLDGVPVSLLHALSWPARNHADEAQWERFEAALLHRDADNLASWLHRVSQLHDDPAALDAWLRRAAQRIDRYESLSFEPVVLMVDALASQPMQPELAEYLRFHLAENLVMIWEIPGERETAAAARAGDRALWAIPVMGVHAATAVPSLGDFAKACSVEETELRIARREACLSLIRRALPGAGNLLDQGVLTGIWYRLVAGTTEEPEAMAERRAAQWQRHHGISAMTTDLDLESWLDYHATPGSSELGWVRRNMRARNIPWQPPEDWDPKTADPFHRP